MLPSVSKPVDTRSQLCKVTSSTHASRSLRRSPLSQAQRPLEDPLVFGNYNVAYVSTGPTQSSNPAGGRFRGGLGKLLFRTTLLAQSVLQPDVVTNKVRLAVWRWWWRWGGEGLV